MYGHFSCHYLDIKYVFCVIQNLFFTSYNPTHISSSLVDHLHVALAGALVGEALLAVVALVRLHPQVDPHVPGHVRPLHELLRAVRASVPDV